MVNDWYDVVMWSLFLPPMSMNNAPSQKAHDGTASAITCSKDFLFTSFFGCIKVLHDVCRVCGWCGVLLDCSLCLWLVWCVARLLTVFVAGVVCC